MMNCRDIQPLLATQRELPLAQRRQVQAHLAACAACNAEWTAQERAVHALQALPAAHILLPPRVNDAVQRAIASSGSRSPLLTRPIVLGGLLIVVGLLVFFLRYPAGIYAPSASSTPASATLAGSSTTATTIQTVPTPTPTTPRLDGSALLMSSEEGMRSVDLVTGAATVSYAPIIPRADDQYLSPHLLSRDGTKFAAFESHGRSCESSAGGSMCVASADVLHLLDLSSQQVVTTTLAPKSYVDPLVFSPDNSRLALVKHKDEQSTLVVLDSRSGTMLAEKAIAFPPELLAWTADGTTLILYGTPRGTDPGMTRPDPPQVLLLDAATLAVKWEQQFADVTSGHWCTAKCEANHGERVWANWRPAVVLAPDQRTLYIVHADAERVTTVDLVAQRVQSVDIRAAQSWADRLLALTADVAQAKGAANGTTKAAVMSGDGSKLYVVGHTDAATGDRDVQTSQTHLGLQVVDSTNGRILTSQPSDAFDIRTTPDAAHLLLDGWTAQKRWTTVLDAQSLEPVTRLEGWEVVTTQHMNGQMVVLAQQPGEQQTQLAVLNPQSFALIRVWSVDGYAAWVGQNP